MNTEVKNNEKVETPEEKPEKAIDFEKFDSGKEEENLTPEEKYEKELEELRARARAAEEKAEKIKRAFDKAASDRAALAKKVDEVKQNAEEPLEKLQEYERKLREYELNEKKTNLTYSLTESLGVNKDMSDKIVAAIYNEDTNELSVGDLELALRDLVSGVREAAYQEGYQTRDAEVASGKPRSLGGKETGDVFDDKLAAYQERIKR